MQRIDFPVFSSDWFSPHIPLFERFLAPLKNTPCRILEIGSYEGRSATWLLDCIVTHPAAWLDIVDICEHPKLRANLAATNRLANVAINIGPSAEVLRTLPANSFDFIYVDGDHSTAAVLDDAVNGFRLLKTEGVMAFDDYLWNDTGGHQYGRPKEAVDAFLHAYACEIELMHRGHQVWIRKTPRQRIPLGPLTLSPRLLVILAHAWLRSRINHE